MPVLGVCCVFADVLVYVLSLLGTHMKIYIGSLRDTVLDRIGLPTLHSAGI